MAKRKLFKYDVTASTINTCPLCRGGNAEFWSFKDGNPRFEGWCPACTNMRISHAALELIKQKNKGHLLSAFLRDLPEVEWNDLQFIDTQVERLADSVSAAPLIEQFDRLLLVICEQTSRFGADSAFNYETDWPLIRARDATEVLSMVKALKQDGYLANDDARTGMFVTPSPTRKAFERYSELRSAGPMSQQAFVAMAFASEFDEAWLSIIQPGIIAAGYIPFRVDKKEHADKIDDLIMAEIRRSKFLVADFSGQRGGVYFEAGFAHGLGRPVIWMCREEESKELHFDTRQYNHILYSDPTDAAKKLRDRIVAMLREGTYKPVDLAKPPA